MNANVLRRFGEKALVTVLVLSLSVMMIPAIAFADENDDLNDAFNSEYKNDADYYESDGERANEAFWFNVEATGGQAKNETSSSINVSVGYGGAQAKSKDDGSSATARVDGSVTAGGTGVSVNSRRGSATLEAGDVNAENDGQFGANVSSWYANSSAVAKLGNISAGAGIRVESNRNGSATLEAGDVKATKGDAEHFDANSISSSDGGKTSATIGDVTSAASGLVLSAGGYRGASETTVKAGTVTADESGLLVDSDKDGKISATVQDINAKGTALNIRNMGGQSTIVVNGDAVSSGGNALVYINIGEGNGKDTVLVTETLSGATNGVVLGMGGKTLDLTVWQIKAGSGSIISNDVDESFAKSVNYIVKIEQPGEGAKLMALKADGTALDTSQGYAIAHEGDKVILKIDAQEGYEIIGAYNGKDELIPLLKDENGNYYVVVTRGGGIYLSVALSGDGDALFADAGTNPSADAGSSPSVEATDTPVSTKAADTAVPKTAGPSKTGDTPLAPLALVILLVSSCTLLVVRRRLS